MTKQEAVQLFRNQSDLAEALGISRSAVSQWDDEAHIPEVHELRIRYVLRPEHFETSKTEAA